MPSSTGTAAPSAPIQVKAEEPAVEPPFTPSQVKPEPSDDTKLLIKDELSPGTKRRQSATSATASTERASAPKRPKAGRKPVKVLPTRYELCAVEDLVILIASMISELIETNDGLPLRTGMYEPLPTTTITYTEGPRSPPGISVSDYLQRLAKHATLTPPILLSMVYYCDRLCALYPAFTVTTLTVHRFLITAATVASKGLSDSFWNNATYARVGGVKLAELGLLELDFLYRVDWRIVPNPEVLVDYYKGLVERNDNYVLEGTVKSGDEDSEDEEDDEVSDASDTILEQTTSNIHPSSSSRSQLHPRQQYLRSIAPTTHFLNSKMRFLPPSILPLLLLSAQPIHSQPETDLATIYIQPLSSSSSSAAAPIPLLTLSYNPSTLSSSIQEYSPPSDLLSSHPDPSSLALLGILDPLSSTSTPTPKPSTSTSLISLENFAKGYTPTFIVTLDHEGAILGVSAKSGVVDAGATRDFGPKTGGEGEVAGVGAECGFEPRRQSRRRGTGEDVLAKSADRSETNCVFRYWWILLGAMFLMMTSGGGGE
ncbi:nuc-1 negative regulatory preg protein [Rutstroemia sp. NJR-2017a BBW]|nr:nuc-1 negative regulatory preg protein [Rutstroemia sp. NJR-2017a BBW]